MRAAAITLAALVLGVGGCKKEGAGEAGGGPPATGGAEETEARVPPGGAEPPGCAAEGRFELEIAFAEDPDLPPGASGCPGRPTGPLAFTLQLDRAGAPPVASGTGLAARWRVTEAVARTEEGACEISVDSVVEDASMEGTQWFTLNLKPRGRQVTGTGNTMYEDPEGNECGDDFTVTGRRSATGGQLAPAVEP
jgi:hypothetical protein